MAGTKSKLICGTAFEITQPYDAGHVLTEAEAKTLNQVRSENIGNNLRDKIKELLEKGDTQGAVDLVAEKDMYYVFTLTSSGGGTSRKLDPVEREARAIAKDIIKAHLDKTGRKINKAPDGETAESWAEKIESHIEAQMAREEVLKEAKKRVASKQKVIDAGLESLDATA